MSWLSLEISFPSTVHFHRWWWQHRTSIGYRIEQASYICLRSQSPMSMCSATATEETSGTLLSSCYSLPSASRQSCTHVQRLPSPSLILRLERSMHDSQLKLEQGTLAYFSAIGSIKSLVSCGYVKYSCHNFRENVVGSSHERVHSA